MADVIRYEPNTKSDGLPMYLSKSGRYVHYNDWKAERTEVNRLRAELFRLYFLLEGVVDVDVTGGDTKLVISLDQGTGEVPGGV